MKLLPNQNLDNLESAIDYSDLESDLNIYRVTTKLNSNFIVDHILDMKDLLEESNTIKHEKITKSINLSYLEEINITDNKNPNQIQDQDLIQNKILEKVYGILVVDNCILTIKESLDSIASICRQGIIVYTRNFIEQESNNLEILEYFVKNNPGFQLWFYDINIINNLDPRSITPFINNLIASKNNLSLSLCNLSSVFNYALLKLSNLLDEQEFKQQIIERDNKILINLSPLVIYNSNSIIEAYKSLLKNSDINMISLQNLYIGYNIKKDTKGYFFMSSSLFDKTKALFQSKNPLGINLNQLQVVSPQFSYSHNFICRLSELVCFDSEVLKDKNLNILTPAITPIFSSYANPKLTQFYAGIDFSYLYQYVYSIKSTSNISTASQNKLNIKKVIPWPLFNNVNLKENNLNYSFSYHEPSLDWFKTVIYNVIHSLNTKQVQALVHYKLLDQRVLKRQAGWFITNYVLNVTEKNFGYQILDSIIKSNRTVMLKKYN